MGADKPYFLVLIRTIKAVYSGLCPGKGLE